MRFRWGAVALALIGLYLNLGQSDAAEVRVLAIGATAPTLHRVIPEFERTTGHKVTVWFGPPGPIRKKIMKGETVDVLFIAGPLRKELLKARLIEPGFPVGKFGVGIGIRKGAAKPDVSTADALRATLIAAKSVGGLPDNGSVGTLTIIGFRRLGIADQMVPKYHAYPNGASVVQALVKGDIELGFSVFADMAAPKGIDYAGPYPAEIQTYRTVYAAMRAGAVNAAAARSFIELVRSMATPQFLKDNWLLPADD